MRVLYSYIYAIINLKQQVMKKKIFTSMFIVLCLFGIVNAQVEQGKWLVGGSSNLGLNFGKEKVKSGSTTTDYYKYSQFNLSPMIGYTVMDGLPVGLSLDFELSTYKYSNNNIDKEQYTTFGIGPFVRYYFGSMSGLMPYAEGRIGFGSQNNKTTNNSGTSNTNKSSDFNYRLGVGATHFIGNAVGIDLFLGYNHNQTTYKSNDGGDDTIYKDGSVMFKVGVIVMLGE